MKLTFAVLLLIACVPLALAQGGTYTQVDVPGEQGTFLLGIDSAGDVVGGYLDFSNNYHGFLLSNGVYTTIDYPGQTYNSANGINPDGTHIVGQFIGNPNAGYLYDIKMKTFTEIYVNGSHQTQASGISNAGTIVGSLSNSSTSQAFQLIKGHFQYLLPDGYSISGAAAINSSGQVLLCASNGSGCSTFLFIDGQFRRVAIPVAHADAAGMNDEGEIVGAYGTSTQLTTGFVFRNRVLTSLVFPGAMYTIAASVNNSGEVVGYFFDSAFVEHGFIWTPPAAEGKK